MRAILPLITLLSACGTIGLEDFTPDTGEDLEPGDAPPYGGDTQINEDDTGQQGQQDTEDEPEDTDNNGGGGGGGDTEENEPNPELSIDAVSDSGTTLTVAFTLTDDEYDITGGTLWMTVAGTTYGLDIPGDLDSWENGGTSLASVEISPCQMGSEIWVKLSATDASGYNSGEKSTSHTLTTPEILVDTARSDDYSNTYTTLGSSGVNLGTLSRPSIICGNLYEAAKNYTGDVDYLDFRAGFSGSTTFTLTWEQNADYDLYLYEATNGSGIADSYNYGLTQPESFSTSISNSQSYILLIAGWEGDGGDWMVVVE